jgi:hypothetical protein
VPGRQRIGRQDVTDAGVGRFEHEVVSGGQRARQNLAKMGWSGGNANLTQQNLDTGIEPDAV